MLLYRRAHRVQRLFNPPRRPHQLLLFAYDHGPSREIGFLVPDGFIYMYIIVITLRGGVHRRMFVGWTDRWFFSVFIVIQPETNRSFRRIVKKTVYTNIERNMTSSTECVKNVTAFVTVEMLRTTRTCKLFYTCIIISSIPVSSGDVGR